MPTVRDQRGVYTYGKKFYLLASTSLVGFTHRRAAGTQKNCYKNTLTFIISQ